MKKTAGEGMRTILGSVTNNRIIAVAVGAFVTMIIQSSSATTVMLVSFVQAQLMTFSQSLGIILGADIGTTITAQLIAFKLTDYALLMIAVGIILMLLTKNQKVKDVGETVLGFGLLFFGMHVMSESMYPLRTHPVFIDLLVNLENPIVGIMIGTIFTALIQSSSAVTGILIVLATQGVLTLEAAIPILLGANIGTCVTAVLATIDTGREAKRVALAHTMFKVLGVLLFVWWIPSYADLVRWVSPKGTPDLTGAAHLADVLPRQIANAHTIFNVALTLLLLPWTQLAARFFTWFLPDKQGGEAAQFKTEYIDNALISTPALALNLAKAEVLRMAGIVGSMVEKIIVPFTEGDRNVLAAIDRSEEEVDFLDQKTSRYLTKISRQGVHEERVDEVFQMMYAVTELEQIADIVSKTLRPRADAWLAGDYEFSVEGREELCDFHLRAIKQLSRAISVFDDLNLEKAKNLKKKHKKYRAMEEQFRRAHFERLRRDIPETVATTEFHQELMEQFRRISGHATNIGRIVLAWSEHVKETKGNIKPE
jgi:phosphate:Na+ symporter